MLPTTRRTSSPRPPAPTAASRTSDGPAPRPSSNPRRTGSSRRQWSAAGLGSVRPAPWEDRVEKAGPASHLDHVPQPSTATVTRLAATAGPCHAPRLLTRAFPPDRLRVCKQGRCRRLRVGKARRPQTASPPSRRPGAGAFPRFRIASRPLRVPSGWPSASLDPITPPGSSCSAMGSVALPGQVLRRVLRAHQNRPNNHLCRKVCKHEDRVVRPPASNE